MFRLYHLVWWSLNFSFERAKSLYSCSSLGVGENVGPNREECLSCHCPPFPTVAARQPGLFHLALTVLPLPSLVLSRKFILSFHFQCYYLVQDFITPYLDYHNRLLPGLCFQCFLAPVCSAQYIPEKLLTLQPSSSFLSCSKTCNSFPLPKT